VNVQHFGLHWAEGGIPFLHEQAGGKCLWDLDLPSPFSTSQLRRFCPHNIAIQSPEPGELAPGLDVLAPRVNGGAFFVPNLTTAHQQAAELLTSAVKPISFAVWAMRWTDLVSELTLTNIQPMFLTGVEPKHYIQLQRLLELPRTRTLIVHGKHNRPGLVQIELPDVQPDPSVRKLGAYILRNA
jgi:hypothetical protein